MGGLVGGVIGDPLAGLSVLPVSSVKPCPALLEPDAVRLRSEIASMFDCAADPAGDEVVGESFTLKRDLLSEVVNVEGADFLFTNAGA